MNVSLFLILRVQRDGHWLYCNNLFNQKASEGDQEYRHRVGTGFETKTIQERCTFDGVFEKRGNEGAALERTYAQNRYL